MHASPSKRESCSCCHWGTCPVPKHAWHLGCTGRAGRLFPTPGKPESRMEPASCSAQNGPKEAEGGRAELTGPEGNFHHAEPPRHPNVTQSPWPLHMVNETLRGWMGDHEGAQPCVATVEGGVGVGGERGRAEVTPESRGGGTDSRGRRVEGVGSHGRGSTSGPRNKVHQHDRGRDVATKAER